MLPLCLEKVISVMLLVQTVGAVGAKELFLLLIALHTWEAADGNEEDQEEIDEIAGMVLK